MFALAFLANQANRSSGGLGLRSDGRNLPEQIRAYNVHVERLSARVGALQRQIEDLTAAQAPEDRRVAALDTAAGALAPATGLGSVQGPAVRVSLDDAKRDPNSLPDGFTPDDMVVHQQDVQGVVNALWHGGAEAMQIMDQRVISTSAVRCVGNTLVLQGRVYSPPFVITAIVDATTMRAALDADPTVRVYRQYVDAIGLRYDLETLDHAELPAYSGLPMLSHATAIE